MAIEVDIAASPSGGLEIIRSIPSERPCRLEGRNGIGKSVAIRLLSLASGDQPYASDQSSWTSLKKLLAVEHPAVLTLKGLSGTASSAELTFTPDKWPDQPPLEIEGWLGVLCLDGRPSPLADLQSQFEVVHLAGTEKLADTVSRRRGQYLSALEATRGRLANIVEQRATLGEVESEFRQLAPRQEERERHELQAAERRVTELSDQIERAHGRLSALQRLGTLQAMLIASTSSDRVQEVDAARAETLSAQGEVKECEKALDVALRALGKGNQHQKDLATKERRLRTLRQSLDKARGERATAANELGLSDIADDQGDELPATAVAEVQGLLATARQDLAELERQEYERSLSSEESEIRRELSLVVDAAIRNGHGDFVIARLAGQDVSIATFATGLRASETAPSSANAAALLAARHRVMRLQNILDTDAQMRKLASQITLVAAEIAAASETSGQTDLERGVRTARERLDAASGRSRAASMRLGQLSAGMLTGTTAEDARAEVSQLSKELEIADGDEVAASLASTAQQQAELSRQLAEVNQTIEGLRSSETRRRIARRKWIARFAEDESLGWLKPEIRTTSDTAPQVDWQMIADRLSNVRKTLDRLADDVDTFVASTRSHAESGAHAEALQSVLEAEALRDFSDDHLLKALFDEGQVERLNLRDQTITWRTASQERRTRPLTAFSSGEQALGFIRARLRQIAAVEAQNRMIFLDEFGAFVAADQRRPLAELLTDEELNPLSSQIIVVLPLQADYASELSQTTGELHDKYVARAAEIAAHGYFTETFTS